MTHPHILTSLRDQVQIIEISRIEKKNALTNDMYHALRTEIEGADLNPDVNVILLRGAGGVFTAGNDIHDFKNRPKDAPSPGQQFMHAMNRTAKPIIAQVEGLAIGIGTTMLLHCDLVYVADGTRLRMPFVDLGLCPEAGSSLLLPMRAGHRGASELLLLSDFFTANEAVAHGIANRVLPGDEIADFVWAQALKLAAKDQTAVRESKRLLKSPYADACTKQIDAESAVFSRLLQSETSRKARANTLSQKN